MDLLIKLKSGEKIVLRDQEEEYFSDSSGEKFYYVEDDSCRNMFKTDEISYIVALNEKVEIVEPAEESTQDPEDYVSAEGMSALKRCIGKGLADDLSERVGAFKKHIEQVAKGFELEDE